MKIKTDLALRKLEDTNVWPSKIEIPHFKNEKTPLKISSKNKVLLYNFKLDMMKLQRKKDTLLPKAIKYKNIINKK